MIYIGLPGTNVPTWFQVTRPTQADEDAKTGSITWGGPVVVWSKGGAYHVRGLFGGRLMNIRNCVNVTIVGQSPPGRSGGVVFYSNALIKGWHVSAVVAAVVARIYF